MNISDLAEDYLVDPKEGMRKLTADLLNEVMQLEAEKQIQARRYERTDKRKAHRNGTRPHSLKTIHGKIELQKPQIREFSFKTRVFERYSRVEESVRVAVAESYLEGVSTRKVEKVFSKFGLEHLSASEVSRIAKKLDKSVKDFLDRPIDGPIIYLFVDASYFKVRTDGGYINKALLSVTGIREDGYREILSATVADSEDEPCWESCFDGLKARGLAGVKLVISDAHKGIQAAVERSFLGASWQMSLTEVSESFDEVETCAMFISCALYSRTYRRKTKGKLLTCLRMLSKMRARCRKLPSFLMKKDTKRLLKPLIDSGSTCGITNRFPDHTGERSEPLTAWRESTKSSNEEVVYLELIQMINRS